LLPGACSLSGQCGSSLPGFIFPLLFAFPDAPLLCTNGQAGADLVA
jgi:hypothetical protein